MFYLFDFILMQRLFSTFSLILLVEYWVQEV